MEEKVEKKKTGYGLFIFIFILFALFIWFLPDFNDFLKGDFSSLGFLQKDKEKNDDTNKEDDTEREEQVLTCNLSKTENDLTSDIEVKIYSVDNKLKKNSIKYVYTAATEASRVDLTSTQTSMDTLGNNIKNYLGITFDSTINDNVYEVNYIIDYSKVNKNEWTNQSEDELIIKLSKNYYYNDIITSIKNDLTEQGYTCKQ